MVGESPDGPSGPRRECAVQAFLPQAKTLAEGRLRRPEHSNTEGWRPPSAAGTQNKRQLRKQLPFILVPVTGLEPVRCRQRWILSPLRLPIPSHRQTALFQDSFYIIAKDRKFCKHNFWAVCRLPSAGVNPAPADGPAPVTWNTQTPSPAEGWGPCAERSAPGGGGRSDSTRCRPDRRSWSAPPASCGR